MTIQVAIDQAIKEVCPIHGISFCKISDKSTWEIHFMDEATPDQRRAAQIVLNQFVWNEKIAVEFALNEKVAQYKDDLSMRASYSVYLKDNPDASFKDYIKSLNDMKIS